MLQIELFSADLPYIGLTIKNVQTFIPFRHTLEFFTKSHDHDTWSFESMDEDEFPAEIRKINDWDWIIVLDRMYNHGTMICCTNETIHGNRFSIHSKKNYRVRNNIHLDVSLNIGESGPEIFDSINESIKGLHEALPHCFHTVQNVQIRPEGRVCMYVMNCLKYSHALNN